MGLVLLVGTIAGIWAALRPNSLADQAIRLTGLVGVSIPDFWLAFVLILIFAVYLGWLPSFGAKSWLHLILPAFTLAVGQAARLSRLTRSILRESLRQDYMRTARAKGLSRPTLLFRHALPNIAVPFVTVVAYQFSALISGTVIIETVFSWRGLGSYYIEAVNFRDLPVIQATVLLFGAIIIFSNLLADLTYGLFDPRLRLS
jgi:ABC-type dipeptide/oligopeptide/nickel transport system permease component